MNIDQKIHIEEMGFVSIIDRATVKHLIELVTQKSEERRWLNEG